MRQILEQIEKEFNFQAKLVQQLQTELVKYRWIPVSERLPKGTWNVNHKHLSQEVLVLNTAGVSIGFYNRNDRTWYTDEPAKKEWIDKITHWKPIILPDVQK